VEVAPQAAPPVCRIMDFNNLNTTRKKKNVRPKNTSYGQGKRDPLHPNIDENDYLVKMRHARVS